MECLGIISHHSKRPNSGVRGSGGNVEYWTWTVKIIFGKLGQISFWTWLKRLSSSSSRTDFFSKLGTSKPFLTFNIQWTTLKKRKLLYISLCNQWWIYRQRGKPADYREAHTPTRLITGRGLFWFSNTLSVCLSLCNILLHTQHSLLQFQLLPQSEWLLKTLCIWSWQSYSHF